MAEENLRERLREAARAHEPDRARMLARVERGMADSADTGTERRRRPARARPWSRTALAAAAAVGALVAGGYAVTTAVRGPEPPEKVTVRPLPPAGPGEQQRPASPSAPAGPDGGAPRTEDGPLWSDGLVDPHSNAYWAQSNVTVQTKRPLTALTVELRIAQTGGVHDTGNWSTLPPADFTVSVGERDGVLVYRWTLKAGRTVPAGRHVFAGQYNHAQGGRDAKDDAYTATAEGPGGPWCVRGAF
ncbi:hypothetical protein CP973_24630 [Streptomyces albofaciens JCM 4342]|uniref:hypothetical protein n=1 Tax=Streptomyces albofaciens TaxID=66866 RepID=UPI00123B807A|nr:hypothetical protein [Streptomyces albofaciens]KAA6212568.1 hypothetical protein CP973_24630 [Streptomyces albofaciens JCM 4342]